jgi:hypothetical protein
MAHHAKRPVADLACTGVVGGAQEIKKPLSDFVMGSTGAAGGSDGFRAMSINDRFQAVSDLKEGVIPGYFLPAVFPPSANTLQRIVQAARMIKILDYIPATGTTLGDGIRRF